MKDPQATEWDYGVWAPEKPVDEGSRWRSASHERGPGRVHYLSPDDAGNTLCGKRLREIGGARAKSDDIVTCKLCLGSAIRRVEREKMRLQYIKSPEWRAKANMVLRRAGFICEGCLVNRATQVHHMTYEHLGDEFAWELRAVCHGCHERFHEERRPATREP